MNESSLTEFMEQPSLYSDDRERTRNLLLLHIAASCPTDAQELSRRVTRPVKLVQEDLKELMRRDAVIVHEGTLRAPAAQRLISTADSLEVQKVHGRSEEHTSELQSRGHLVCRLLLEKKKTHR